MATRPLPTGEEPPKGFESLVGMDDVSDELKVNCVIVSQLASIEYKEIEELRSKALAAIANIVGLAEHNRSFEHEINVIEGKSDSDKLLFRAYLGHDLVGYALVVTGWPNPGEWVIQHMIIDPAHRLRGIGSTIVRTVERFAMSSEVDATSIFAIPIQKSGATFWNDMGYTVETGRLPIRIADLDHELIIYRKGMGE